MLDSVIITAGAQRSCLSVQVLLLKWVAVGVNVKARHFASPSNNTNAAKQEGHSLGSPDSLHANHYNIKSQLKGTINKLACLLIVPCYCGSSARSSGARCSVNTDRSWSVSLFLLLSLFLQEVGPNSSGDVRGLCQQDTGSRTSPPIHPSALDDGAASVLRHGDEEPGAQRAALTSHSGRHLYFVSVPFVFGYRQEPCRNSRCYGWTRRPPLCLKSAALKHEPAKTAAG